MSKGSEEIRLKLPAGNTPEDQQKLADYWQAFDVNGNGYLSLAEVDRGIQDVVKLPILFNLKPVILRAFYAAKNKLKSKNPHGDDFVSKAEFKFLILYLRQYYEYWTAFEAIDTSDDRRVSEQ
jgi:hypothetical protein